jgi:hypothetical protein
MYLVLGLLMKFYFFLRLSNQWHCSFKHITTEEWRLLGCYAV